MGRTLIVAACMALAACGGMARASQDNRSPGVPKVQRHYELAAFDKVSTTGPHVILVSVGGAQSVRAEGPAVALDKMEAVVERGELQIRPKREYRRDPQWRDGDRATFYVTLPHIAAATMAGSGDMKVDNVEGSQFTGTVAGSGMLELAMLRVHETHFTMAGSGGLRARGSTSTANLAVAGSGRIDAHGVTSDTASVSIAGSGTAELTARDAATVSIVGSGEAEISGQAKCTIVRMGTGNARCHA